MSIAILGNCYFDEIYSIDDFPEPDQKLVASDLVIVLGGSATNTSCGITDLGLDANLFTVMGDDEDAYRLFREVRKKGINTQYINHIDGKSGRTIILLDKNKSSTKIGYQGVCSDMSQTILFEGLSNQKIDHVHMSSVNINTIKQALKYKVSQRYSLDFGAKTQQAGKNELLQVMDDLDIVFLNRGTFNRLFEITVDQLHTLELPYDLIITAGTDGIYGNFDGKVYHQGIIPTDNIVDTTGAGDAVAAGVIYAYTKNMTPEQILRVGVTAASIKIQSFGGSNGHATVEDLQHIIE